MKLVISDECVDMRICSASEFGNTLFLVPVSSELFLYHRLPWWVYHCNFIHIDPCHYDGHSPAWCSSRPQTRTEQTTVFTQDHQVLQHPTPRLLNTHTHTWQHTRTPGLSLPVTNLYHLSPHTWPLWSFCSISYQCSHSCFFIWCDFWFFGSLLTSIKLRDKYTWWYRAV